MSNIFPGSAMPDPDWWQELWPHPAQTVALLGVIPGMFVVDLCCGDGLFTLSMAKLASKVVAIDLDPEMLKRMQAKLDAAGMRNCSAVEGNSYDVGKLAGMNADMVVMANTFHGVPDKTRLCQAVASALKPAGQFVVVNWHRRPREETTVLEQPRGPKTEMRMEPEDVAAIAAPAASILSPQSSFRPFTTP
ncbi:MAG: class I SAM-dependent methyltransferase [Methylocystis sp.]|uniref:class I SAM-dependent methyltransferase n=1 Tax=Methylocystis sp. TaxID=1911079 RepID=UPI003DA2FEB9